MRKMTKRERAQVVELLRCAADNEDSLRDIEADCDCPRRLTMEALRAWDVAYRDVNPGEYRRSCLEAAQRVEEGTWP